MTRFDTIRLNSFLESNNQVIKGLFNTVYETVNHTCGKNQEKAMALMYLEQAYMWAHKALTVEQLETNRAPAPVAASPSAEFQQAVAVTSLFNPSQSLMPNLLAAQQLVQPPPPPAFSADGLVNGVADLEAVLKSVDLAALLKHKFGPDA